MDLEHVAALGRVFAQRGQRKHLEHARAFYRGLRSGNSAGCAWNEEHVRRWLAVLQLPPFEAALRVLPRSARCHGCGERCVFAHVSLEDRTLFECCLCKAQWLELVKPAA